VLGTSRPRRHLLAWTIPALVVLRLRALPEMASRRCRADRCTLDQSDRIGPVLREEIGDRSRSIPRWPLSMRNLDGGLKQSTGSHLALVPSTRLEHIGEAHIGRSIRGRTSASAGRGGVA